MDWILLVFYFSAQKKEIKPKFFKALNTVINITTYATAFTIVLHD
jgi:hypothetical protein